MYTAVWFTSIVFDTKIETLIILFWDPNVTNFDSDNCLLYLRQLFAAGLRITIIYVMQRIKAKLKIHSLEDRDDLKNLSPLVICLAWHKIITDNRTAHHNLRNGSMRLGCMTLHYHKRKDWPEGS